MENIKWSITSTMKLHKRADWRKSYQLTNSFEEQISGTIISTAHSFMVFMVHMYVWYMYYKFHKV